MNKALAWLALGVPLLLLSCATTSTKVTTAWKAPAYSGTIVKALIIGVSNVEAYRIKYENDFSRALKQYGVEGIPSFTLFTSTGIPSRDTITAAVRDSGADTVLLTQVVDREKIQTYVPGSSASFGDDFYGYYAYSWNYNYSPGYTIVNRIVVMQTNLYKAADQKLFWTAVSDTTTRGTNADAIDSFIQGIVKQMRKDKLIGAR